MGVTMDEEMRRKVDAVLERVKDPESGYSVARLGLVERVRYNAEKGALYVFTDFLSHQPSCMACVGIASIVISGIRRSLVEQFQAEFPDLSIELV